MEKAEPYIQEQAEENFTDALVVEIPKILLSNNLEFIRGTMQALQGLTSILLTSYIALLVGFRKDISLRDIRTLLVAFLPIAFWGLSLFGGFIIVIIYLRRGSRFTYGDLESTVNAYEEVVSARLKQFFWPAILSFFGLICFIISFFVVFLPALPQGIGPTN